MKRPCYHCGSNQNTFYAAENGFDLVKCGGCGLLFVDEPPDPEQIATAARDGRHRGQRELHVTGRFNPAAIPRYIGTLKDVFGNALAGKRTWLDVGCGHGEFVQAIREVSGGAIAARGMEPNVHKVASARSRGLDVADFDLASHDRKYDVVSMLDVYSHIPDPPAFIGQVARLLNPRGELLVQTGDACDLAADEQIKPYDLPDHLSFASERIVVSILERTGFEVVGVRKYSYLYRDPLSIAKEIVKLFVPGYHSRLKYYLRWGTYARTNMFVRARLRG